MTPQASNEVASLVIACVLGALIVLWLILELTVLDKYTRWTISPGFSKTDLLYYLCRIQVL